MNENNEFPRKARPELSPYLENKIPYWEKKYGYLLAAVFGLITTLVRRKALVSQ